MAVWTDERVAELKRLFDAGMAFSQIAEEMGLTRNTVIGKAGRLELFRSAEVVRGAQQVRPKRKVSPRPRPRLQALRLAKREDPPPLGDPGLPDETPTLFPMRKRSIMTLKQGECRWPCGDVGTKGFFFCGNDAERGLPYCSGHELIAHEVPVPRRRTYHYREDSRAA